MTDFHELLSAEAARQSAPPPPIGPILARARERQARRRITAAAGGVALCVIVGVPIGVLGTRQPADKPVGQLAGGTAVPSQSAASSSTAAPNLGVCADVRVHVTYPGGETNFAPGAPAQITVNRGQSFILTASGTCGVEYEPDDVHLAYSAGQSAPPTYLGGAPWVVDSSPPAASASGSPSGPSSTLAPHPVSFVALAPGTTSLPVLVDDHVSELAFDVAIKIKVVVHNP